MWNRIIWGNFVCLITVSTLFISLFLWMFFSQDLKFEASKILGFFCQIAAFCFVFDGVRQAASATVTESLYSIAKDWIYRFLVRPEPHKFSDTLQAGSYCVSGARATLILLGGETLEQRVANLEKELTRTMSDLTSVHSTCDKLAGDIEGIAKNLTAQISAVEKQSKEAEIERNRRMVVDGFWSLFFIFTSGISGLF